MLQCLIVHHSSSPMDDTAIFHSTSIPGVPWVLLLCFYRAGARDWRAQGAGGHSSCSQDPQCQRTYRPLYRALYRALYSWLRSHFFLLAVLFALFFWARHLFPVLPSCFYISVCVLEFYTHFYALDWNNVCFVVFKWRPRFQPRSPVLI